MKSLMASWRPSLIPPRLLSSNRISLVMMPRSGRVRRKGIRSVGGDDMDGHNGHCSGRMVDEDIITLRLRMKEVSSPSPSPMEAPNLEWMEWERSYFGYYHKDVYALVGLLQTALMNTRPCLALGVLAFLAMAVVTSLALSLLLALQAMHGISI